MAIAEGTAEYEIVFTSAWVPPPGDPSFPHFSGLIGGTHNAQADFWEPGVLASEGIERMAETGSKTALRNEVEAAIGAGTANAVISGGGISPSPASVSVTFETTPDFPLLTLVSMIAPSPDWFVGVDSYDLRPNGQWIEEATIQLPGWDSGTDSGPDFASPNDDTNPAEPIARLEGVPFVGTTDGVATFTVRLLGVTGAAEGEGEVLAPSSFHAGDIDKSGDITLSELLRVIQFFNSDAYHCNEGGEDGFGAGTGAGGCTPHSSDYNPQNWQIEIEELVRVIQLFNSDAYRPCESGEDGFCPQFLLAR